MEWITTYWVSLVEGGVMLGYPTIVLVAWIGTHLVKRAYPGRLQSKQ